MKQLLFLRQGIALSFLLILSACTEFSKFKPITVNGVTEPVISLNGTWKFSMDPPESFWDKDVDFDQWPNIQVPGECQMQGFAIKHDQPFVYKRELSIPKDFAGNNIFLVFYGVYSYARVWVNGEFAREHYGGFTKWDCDITDHVTPGEESILTVEIVDRIDDISYASGYAKHQVGGILRDVELHALPKQHFNQFYFETDLDENFRDAELRVFYELSEISDAKLSLEVFDINLRSIAKSVREDAQQKGELSLVIENPLKWDAEHPRLYTLVTSLAMGDEIILSRTDKVGFREVVVDGNKLLVNGRQVKLRGADRHDIHPLLGRMTSTELDKKDVLLAKEANMNFIRTSHYPPSESFLRYCDEYGLYVEDETAVCFVHTHRSPTYRETGTSQDDPRFTGRYLSQVEEMVDNHRNHPSVIIWSIGNENFYGRNFLKSYQWIKDTDLTRPVIYSYPGQVPDTIQIFDILSMHYPLWNGDLEQYGFSTHGFKSTSMPALFDEWAHVACYNKPTLLADPNVRNFWGQSLDSMWTNLFEADGGLGGAIWCMIDETFMLPDTLDGFRKWWGINEGVLDFEGPCVGYGEWGIIDTWRRKKPEFWGTKKAYSPTRILVKTIEDFESGKELRLPIHNRFDHTNFNELSITWSYKGISGEIDDINLEPHQKGELVIPARDWENGTSINIAFYLENNMLVDDYNIRLGERISTIPVLQEGQLSVREEEDKILIGGDDFSLVIDQEDGLIKDLIMGQEILVRSGPYGNLKIQGNRQGNSMESISNLAQNWRCKSFQYEMKDGIVTILTRGSYDSIEASFDIKVDASGTIQVDYQLDGLPAGMLIQEAGLYFIAGDSFRELSWDRKGYFTAYPEMDLGLQKGRVDLTFRPKMTYCKEPDHDWIHDTKGFYYFGTDIELAFTNMVRALKENIYKYSLKTNEGSSLNVFASGNKACRFDQIEAGSILIINDIWDYPDLLWGNYMKLNPLPDYIQGRATISIGND